ncbi:MAG: Prolipoprotein diacylglyceryl transferase [Candidatus Accumulibacter adjunctus]|uniref:Prolipoprotein diacylglyceryl transferase n=1 Tax=Candidatus Accumulibacter adjunctus TaxID=1454001 RepID=A0A011PNP6_9PROT|nr:MAG: Prolipoprotein diacylglyceryl transferase [Candidatus Accumulibacter adjunctus]
MSTLIGNPLLYWGAGVAATLAVAVWQADRARLDPWAMYLAGIAGFAGGLVGGGVYALLVGPEHAHQASQTRGALGALAGAAALAWFLLRIRGERYLDYADAAAPAIALGYAVYRFGCFFNGCCFGTLTTVSWAVTFGRGTEAFASQVAAGLIAQDAAHTLPVHPAQFYHATVGIVGFLLLLRLPSTVSGTRLAFALAFYGATRLTIEFLRADALPVVGPLDVNQLVCLAMMVGGALVWLFRPSVKRSCVALEEHSP